jgi:hypothetical protein
MPTLTLTPQHPIDLPAFAGAWWRSAWGKSLRARSCITGAATCDGCPVRAHCPYGAVFDSPSPSAGLLSEKQSPPNPYVLKVLHSGWLPADAPITLELRLFGRAHAHESALITALEKAAEQGIGSERVRFSLQTSQPLQPNPCPPAPEKATLWLQTPLRLRVREQELRAETFNFRDFFAQVLRRCTLMQSCHGEGSFPEQDWKALLQQSESITLHHRQLLWYEQSRYSARQGQSIPTSGLLGSVELRGDLAPFWPFLWQGQWLHVGKNAVMGMGGYRLI